MSGLGLGLRPRRAGVFATRSWPLRVQYPFAASLRVANSTQNVTHFIYLFKNRFTGPYRCVSLLPELRVLQFGKLTISLQLLLQTQYIFFNQIYLFKEAFLFTAREVGQAAPRPTGLCGPSLVGKLEGSYFPCFALKCKMQSCLYAKLLVLFVLFHSACSGK